MPQNFYSELDPNHFAENLLNTYDPENPMKQQASEETDLAKAIASQIMRRDQAGQNVDKYQQDLNYDPIATANKQYRDKYKWKGQTKTTKAKSIGTGILDVLGIASGKGLKQTIQGQTEDEFKRRQQTIPQQITNERITENNANNAVLSLQNRQAKKEENEALLDFKTLLMNAKSLEERDNLKLQYDKLASASPMNKAKLELIKAQAGLVGQKTESEKLPKNIFGAATLHSQDKLPPTFMRSFETLSGFQNKNKGRPANLQLSKDSNPMTNVVMDDDGNIKLTPFKEQTLFNPSQALNLTMEERLQKIPGPAGGRNYPTSGPEFKRLQDTMYSSDLFDQGVTAMLNDVYTGEFKKREIFNDTGIGRKIREMTNNDPVSAESARASLNNQMMSAAQHIRTVIGRFPSAGFAEKLEAGLNAQGGTAVEKFAAQITQKYTLAMAKSSMAGRDDYNKFFHDPQFYDYMQKRSAALYKVTEEKRYRGGAPSLQQLMKDYTAEKQKNKVIDPRNSGPGIPYIQDPRIQQRQQYGNKIPGLKQK